MPALPVIWQPVKVATPALAPWGFDEQVRLAPLPGWVAMAKVMFEPPLVTLPDASSMLTAGWVAQVAPLAPPPGWVLKASWLAGPAVRVNELLVAQLSPVALALRV